MQESHDLRHSPDGISLILPVYNEAENLAWVLDEASNVLQGTGRPFEILCVDDGSTDRSAAVLEELCTRIPELRVLTLARNCGQSAAFGAGISRAVFPVLVTMDADGQNDPADIPGLLEKLKNADICCGVRARRQDSWSKRFGSRIGNAVRNRLLHSEILDTGCSLKAFRREVLQDIHFWKGSHRFLPDLCRIHHPVRIVQIPVSHRPRRGGKSKYSNWGRLWKTLPDLLAVRWMQRRFQTVPRHETSATPPSGG